MWYFAWILGTLLACAFGIITALALEHVEETAEAKARH
ncbi:cytochrome bd-I oxidase subunit CydX [[Pantoea] beijingensis]|nr:MULTISPECIES: cytochrome bd-I oxidase subunit CydX [Erwiniaceae]